MKSPEDRKNDRIVEILTKCNRLGPGSTHGVGIAEFRAALDAAEPGTHYRKVFIELARRIMRPPSCSR